MHIYSFKKNDSNKKYAKENMVSIINRANP